MNQRQISFLKYIGNKDAAFRRKLAKYYAIASKQINAEIAAGFDKYGDDYQNWMAYKRLDGLEAKINESSKTLTKRAIKDMQKQIKDACTDGYYGSIYGVSGDIVGLQFSLINDDQIAAAIDNPYDRIKWPNRLKAHNAAMVDKVRQNVTVGLLNNHGYRAIAKQIRDDIGITAAQAVRIARTETHRAQNTGTLAGYDNCEELNGLKMVRTWYSARDARTRPEHVSMNGKTADEEGYFTFPDGVKTRSPGLSGVAEHDINCRCRFAMELDLNDEQEIKPPKRLPPNVIEAISEKNISFPEWQERTVERAIKEKKQKAKQSTVINKSSPSRLKIANKPFKQKTQKQKSTTDSLLRQLEGIRAKKSATSTMLKTALTQRDIELSRLKNVIALTNEQKISDLKKKITTVKRQTRAIVRKMNFEDEQ